MDSHLCSGLSSAHLSRPPAEMVPFQHKVAKVTGVTARSRRGENLSDGTAVSSDVLATSLIPNTSPRSDSGCCVVLLHQLTSEPNPDFIQFKEDNLFLELLGTSQGRAVSRLCGES